MASPSFRAASYTRCSLNPESSDLFESTSSTPSGSGSLKSQTDGLWQPFLPYPFKGSCQVLNLQPSACQTGVLPTSHGLSRQQRLSRPRMQCTCPVLVKYPQLLCQHLHLRFPPNQPSLLFPRSILALILLMKVP